MSGIRVFIKLEIDPPGSRYGNETVSVSQRVEHGVGDGRLIVQGAEEAIEIATQKILAMVNTAHPDRPGEIEES